MEYLKSLGKSLVAKAWGLLNYPILSLRVWMAVAAVVWYFWSVIVAFIL